MSFSPRQCWAQMKETAQPKTLVSQSLSESITRTRVTQSQQHSRKASPAWVTIYQSYTPGARCSACRRFQREPPHSCSYHLYNVRVQLCLKKMHPVQYLTKHLGTRPSKANPENQPFWTGYSGTHYNPSIGKAEAGRWWGLQPLCTA